METLSGYLQPIHVHRDVTTLKALVQVRTTFQFLMSLAFFLLFGLGCQMSLGQETHEINPSNGFKNCGQCHNVHSFERGMKHRVIMVIMVMSHEWLYIVCIWRKVCIASSSSLLCDWERVHVPFFCKALQNLFNPSTGKVPWLWVQTGSLGNRNRQNSPPILLYSVRCFDLCLYFWSQRNLRIQLTDAATEVAEIPQMFEYMEQTWFPFLWHSPNAAGRADFKSFSWFCRRAALSLSDFFSYHLNMGVTVAGIETSLLPSRQMTLLGGSLRLVNIDP